MILLLSLFACTSPTPEGDTGGAAADDCDGPGALSTCLSPTLAPEYYIEQSSAYFDTMDYTVDLDDWPPYDELVIRWEWPPWLKLTAYTRDNIESTDTFLVLYPSVVRERDCRFFDEQPFGRCTVVFYYDDHDGQPCPIYEEFSFDDQGEITFIEAWSDVDGLRPTTADDPWGEQGDIGRLSTRIPGLGTADGQHDLDGPEMQAAAEADPDVADFVVRANDWAGTWAAEYAAAGDDFWAVGCGW